MALCDWSSLQKRRRSIARMYCSPRFCTSNYEHLSEVGQTETRHLMAVLESRHGSPVSIKPYILAACANMFTQYMCSVKFSYDDEGFNRVVRFFDEIFWEINQGYAVDFLPWLLPLYRRHMDKLSGWAHTIRQFILERIIETHRQTMDTSALPRDFTDALLMHLEEDPDLSWEHIIYELEDFLGGHSAVGNLVMLVLAAVVRHPEVGQRIQEEVDRVIGGREPSLADRAQMPYIEATILEALRAASSPIVPHVATQDTSIAGFTVEKGTVVFLNNYELNSGSDYWQQPEAFRPERFIADGKLVRPEHFIPFSTGKRTCIGQRLVQGLCFILIATLLQRCDITALDLSLVKTYPACVALPPDTFQVIFTPRNVQ